jgi:NifB/MoaA-like Fe-S oxidoreductase
LAYDYLVELFSKIRDKLPGLEIEVVPIVNNFFGEKITVSGLITGYDLISQLKGKRSDGIIIPSSMMKCDEEIFLDNISIEELSRELNTKIIVSKVNGKDLMSKLILGVDYE